MAVASANGIFEIEKNHKYIATNATEDLANCSLYDLVLDLINQHSKAREG